MWWVIYFHPLSGRLYALLIDLCLSEIKHIPCCGVQCFVVDATTPTVVLLLEQQDWWREWTLTGLDEPDVKHDLHLFYEFFFWLCGWLGLMLMCNMNMILSWMLGGRWVILVKRWVVLVMCRVEGKKSLLLTYLIFGVILFASCFCGLFMLVFGSCFSFLFVVCDLSSLYNFQEDRRCKLWIWDDNLAK